MIIQISVIIKKNIWIVFRAAGAAIGTAILAGAAAERMTFLGWSVFAIVYSGFIYAGLTHWTLASGWYFFY